MTRYIAILTLALTAALSADEAFAIEPENCVSALRANYEPDQMLVILGVQIEDSGGGADLYLPDDVISHPDENSSTGDEVPNSFAQGDNLRGSIAVNGFADGKDDLDALIAIIALSQTAEAGMDDITGMLHAYDTLLDIGFSPAETAIVLDILTNNENIPAWHVMIVDSGGGSD